MPAPVRSRRAGLAPFPVALLPVAPLPAARLGGRGAGIGVEGAQSAPSPSYHHGLGRIAVQPDKLIAQAEKSAEQSGAVVLR